MDWFDTIAFVVLGFMVLCILVMFGCLAAFVVVNTLPLL